MTSTPLTLAAVRRRFVLLTALRWLPVGIYVPVSVLLAASRGLRPADIGLLFALYGVVTLLLELPTGGLADTIGHRPVLALSAVLEGGGLPLVAVADGLPAFLLAHAVLGAGRALDSGPLEGWFVDASHRIDPTADLTPGLSRAAAADGGGLAVGAVLGGLLPGLAAGRGGAALTVSVVVAAGMVVVHLVALLVLVTPLPRAVAAPDDRPPRGVRAVALVVRETTALVGRDAVLRRLLGLSLIGGVVLSTLELLGPLRFAELAGNRTDGSAVFGVVMAVSFTASAVGSALAGRVRRAARGSTALATAALAVLCAAAVTGTALAPTVVLAGATYAAFYLANAGAWPLRQQLLHTRVTTAHRATTVSSSSVALMLGGLAGSLLMPRLAEAAGYPVAFAAVALLLIAEALLCLRLGTRADDPAPALPAQPGAARPG